MSVLDLSIAQDLSAIRRILAVIAEQLVRNRLDEETHAPSIVRLEKALVELKSIR